MIDFEKLYKLYAGQETLEANIAWLHSEAARLKIDPRMVDVTFREVFLEMANGLTFSTEGVLLASGEMIMEGVPHAAFNFYLRDRLIEKGQKLGEEYRRILERDLNASIKHYLIQKRTHWTNWTKSPTLRFLKNETRLTDWSKSPIARRLKRGA